MRPRLALALVLVLAGAARADEIKVWTTRALATVLAEVGPQFEGTTHHKLVVSVGLPTEFLTRAKSGEPFDVLITGTGAIDELIEAGVIVAGSRTRISRSGIGVAVRSGARKPDISTVERFKQALLDAKSIAYLNNVGSGIYIGRLLKALGIADELEAKTVRPDSDSVSQLVATGKVELGIVVTTQILTTPGVEFAGPLPPAIQSYVEFVAGIGSRSKVQPAAAELIRYLTGPVAKPVIKVQGMDPLIR